MNSTSVTVDQIEAHISDARERLAMLDRQAQELSLPAVSGNEAAAASLADVNRSIRQVSADLAVLERAKIAAATQNAAADEAAAAAYRAHHLEIAKGHAGEIVKLASQADRLVSEFKALLAGLTETERMLWNALSEAKARHSDTVMWRRGLPRLVIERVSDITQGRDKLRQNHRPVAVVASVAWSDLLESESIEGV